MSLPRGRRAEAGPGEDEGTVPGNCRLGALPHPSRGSLPQGPPPEYPGHAYFGPGKGNIWILLLRLKLITAGWAPEQREALEHYNGWEEGRYWDESLREACTRFQLAQGLRGMGANGYPDADTWQMLWNG
ncbi:hypothetical protein [Streptomyces sp. NPDC002537]